MVDYAFIIMRTIFMRGKYIMMVFKINFFNKLR